MRRTALYWIAMAACVATAGISTAQAPQPGDIGVYLDPAGTQTQGTVQAFVPFDVYVVAFDLEGDLLGYEFSTADAPLPFVVVEEWIPLGNNIGDSRNVIFLLSECASGVGPVVLQRLRLLGVHPVGNDTVICVRGAAPSSFASGRPGWMDCTTTLHGFGLAQSGGGIYPEGCLVLNPPGVCCPTYHHELPAEDTLVPAGGVARIPFDVRRVWDFICLSPNDRPRTTCLVESAMGLRFDLLFDPALLAWDALTPAAGSGVPVAVTENAPGSVHVELGWYADPTWEGDLELNPTGAVGSLDFVLAATGGTTEVQFRNIEGYDAILASTFAIADSAVLVSDDPAVATEALHFGTLKARY